MEISSSQRTIVKEINHKSFIYIRIYNDGTVERPSESKYVPPILDDSHPILNSKDITISQNPLVTARIYLPKLTKSNDQNQLQKLPILVYFHGGGFIFESAFSQVFDNYFKTFVPLANVIVVSVEYRRAPEYHLPACYHDAWYALNWVCSHSTANKNPNYVEPWLINYGDFNRVFIGGDSAGGNITHNIALRAGVEALPGGVKISGAILSHPFFYSSYPVGSDHDYGDDDLAYAVWDLIYPSAPGGIDNPVSNPVDPGAPNLATLGCSKMIVCVAGKDDLRGRGVWYYECVKKSGWQGKIELFDEEKEGHDYHILKPKSKNAQKLMKLLVSFLNE
ncbi:hypothetical protein TanjilG_19561 [Lupinus angustifolius]|uniref:Alpha/beta hydrolase fold-3 domain-containing protein n=1 Tax=Lupinus angustifolius TaxID=3871 RepID=A0A1J7H221_LUPAN|nr:PREDICTED: 2-hydroxyisoflavanone dehydratase-like [Lupinus angustifolius]OIW06912.1 hypothetical protein TanjilG_19561 [Lupinus angustifolius]